MKNIILLLCFIICIIGKLGAQDSEKIYERRGSCLYIELLGAGIGYSINYESRFTKSHRGLGGRLGISRLKGYDEKAAIIVPVMINYSLGKPEGKHFLEMGVGATYLSEPGVEITSNDDPIFFDSNVFATFSVMYRHQPPFGGFLFKFGLTPFIGSFEGQNSPFLFSAGIAFGYAF